MSNKENKSYIKQVALAAPVFGAKALLGDLPKGAIEHAVQEKVFKPKTSFTKELKTGFKGRGLGRALGAGLGIATAPIFLKGLSLAGSSSKSDRNKGLALIAATGGVYAGKKGFSEGYASARSLSNSKAKSILSGLQLGGVRVSYKVPAAVFLGLSVAKGRSSSKGKSPSTIKKLMLPALSGAAVGALSRGAEAAVLKPGGRAGSRAIAAAAAGGGAGGALGGLVLAGAVDGAMKLMKKEASYEIEKLAADPITAGMVGGTLLKGLADVVGIHAVTKGALGYGKAGGRMANMPLTRGVVRRAQKAQARQLAIGIREGIAGRTSEGLRSTIALNMSIPELRLQRQMGMKIGKMLRGVPESKRPDALKWIQRKVKETPELRYSREGEPIPVLSSIPEGVDMALGHKALYGKSKHFPTFKKAWEKMMLSGRGAVDQNVGGFTLPVSGLPRAGFSDAPAGRMLSRSAIPDWLTLTGAIGGGMALGGPVGAALGAHGTWSGIKGLAARTKAIENMASGEAAQGIREALMPRWGHAPGNRFKQHLTDLVVSPEARGFGKLTGALARAGVAKSGRRAGGAVERGVKRALMPDRTQFADVAAMPAAAGLAAGSLYNIKN
tara:strand:- start:2915 stop:4747 length:1833 start_codon:yes stop_codon:yes gene_type:complete